MPSGASRPQEILRRELVEARFDSLGTHARARFSANADVLAALTLSKPRGRIALEFGLFTFLSSEAVAQVAVSTRLARVSMIRRAPSCELSAPRHWSFERAGATIPA